MMNEILQFSLAKGIGEVAVKKAISFLSENQYSWAELCSSPAILKNGLGLKESVIENIGRAKQQSKDLGETLFENGIHLLVETDVRYPATLKKILGKKCPPLLFARGNLSLLNQPSVGFCGSRKTSDKGLDIAIACVKQLVKRDIAIVSGYASGTDLAAHRAALEGGGNTIFILPEGILRTTIKGNVKNLLRSGNHVFVSQFMPSVPWSAANAMKRNSVIIGLSQAMMLIESGKSGGTFAAGETTLNLGRPLFVVDFIKPAITAEANPYFLGKGGIPIRGKGGLPNVVKIFDAIEVTGGSNLNRNHSQNRQIKLSI